MNKIFSRTNPSPHGAISRQINVHTEFVGFHSYKDAPAEVAFLKNSHRHVFHVDTGIEVLHDDRELEFFMVQNLVETEIIPFLKHNDLGSCEQIAEDILWGLINSYGDHRYYDVEVSEDGENSAIITWTSVTVDSGTAGNGQVYDFEAHRR